MANWILVTQIGQFFQTSQCLDFAWKCWIAYMIFRIVFFFLKISKPVLTNFIKSEFSTVSKDHEFHDFAIECFILFPRSSHLPKNVTYWLLQLIKVSKVEVSNTPPNFAHLRCNSKVILPAQCRNFIIFLPLRFYKKAILGILCISAKSAILTNPFVGSEFWFLWILPK